MTYTTTYRWGPEKTPKPILSLIITTAIVSFLATLLNPPFGLEALLSLSWQGLLHFFLWQPISYLFIQNSWGQGINGFYLIGLFLNLYIIWVMGSLILEQFGKWAFFKLYFLTGIFSGCIGLLFMWLTNHFTFLAGPTPVILGLLTIWTMIFPEAELLLFFLLPIKSKWLLIGILGAIILSSLSQFDFVSMAFYSSGPLFAYFYGIYAWDLHGPYSSMHDIENWLKTPFKSPSQSNKIIDFRTGEPSDSDEAFLDEILNKISKYGEKSLSAYERRRLDKISKKKSKR